jgi:hypothetical protein
MNSPTHDQFEEQLAQFRKMLAALQEPAQDDPSRHLGESLLTPQPDEAKNDSADDDWGELIAKALGAISPDTIFVVVLVILVLLLLNRGG